MGVPWEAGEQDWRIRQQDFNTELPKQEPIGPIYYHYRCLDCFNEFTVDAVNAAAQGAISCPKCGSYNVSKI